MLADKIRQLKKEKDVVILAHYYVNDEVQEIADYIGDSFYLSKLAQKVEQSTILFCGVSFMGESAKILNPKKKVILPDKTADCPMAHMAYESDIRAFREKYEDGAVVCYINSSITLKEYADVCVTSSNAVEIVKKLPNRHIYFIPDKNLGRYVKEQAPEKEIILNNGFCPVHNDITKEEIKEIKECYQNAEVLAHPECISDVLRQADYIGSTKELIDYAGSSSAGEFIVCTELGVLKMLQERNPDKRFYSASKKLICPDMKKITLENILNAMEQETGLVVLEKAQIDKARKPLLRMLELAGGNGKDKKDGNRKI